MKKVLKTILPFLFIVIITGILFFGGMIVFGTITEYKPEAGSTQIIAVSDKGIPSNEIDSILNLMIWNLGYGGLGKEADFFYDGGKTVRTPREIWNKNFTGQLKTITSNDSIDFYLLQEIDQRSKRSYFINQYDSVASSLKNYSDAFAENYNVKYVPVPYLNAMGKVYSGIATFSKYRPTGILRYQYPGNFSWPTRIFFLDRGFLLERFPLNSAKQLILINTHNSAYDESGQVKKQEMDFLKEFVIQEYEKGNYVIVGGDFNQCPPEFNTKKFLVEPPDDFIPPAIDASYLPGGWKWCYDDSKPTNRNVDKPLNDKTFKTIIDFYLISPNIEMVSVNTIDNGFNYSDHQPVVLKVKLK